MKGIGVIIKIILIMLVLWIGAAIVTVLRVLDSGVLLVGIVAIAMFTTVGVIWRYQPKSSEETTLQKHE